jgi:HlyD family secretion protein
MKRNSTVEKLLVGRGRHPRQGRCPRERTRRRRVPTGLVAVLALCLSLTLPAYGTSVGKLVCVGRVEPVNGEVEVFARLAGTLIAVPVKEGDWVKAGAVLAEVDAPVEKANLALAEAKLARIKAGNGQEEIAAAQAERDAIAQELAFAEKENKRAAELNATGVMATDIHEQRQSQMEALRHRLRQATMRHEALQRGPLPEEVALVEAEVAAAQATYELRLVRVVSAGQVLKLHKHAGDAVSLFQPAPILRMADARRLRIRLEVSEMDYLRVKAGMEGQIIPHGTQQVAGRLRVTTLLPAFAPRRLFEPDSTARMDTRTINALCEIISTNAPLHCGQRVMAVFE